MGRHVSNRGFGYRMTGSVIGPISYLNEAWLLEESPVGGNKGRPGLAARKAIILCVRQSRDAQNVHIPHSDCPCWALVIVVICMYLFWLSGR